MRIESYIWQSQLEVDNIKLPPNFLAWYCQTIYDSEAPLNIVGGFLMKLLETYADQVYFKDFYLMDTKEFKELNFSL